MIRKIVGVIALGALLPTSSLAKPGEALPATCSILNQTEMYDVCVPSPYGGNQIRTCQFQCVGGTWVQVPGTCEAFTTAC